MTAPYLIYSRYKCAEQATSADVVERVHLIDVQTYCIEEKKQYQKRRISAVAHLNHRTMFYGISTCIWLILPAQSMGKLAKSLKHSIWYASKILNGTRYAEQN